MQCKVFHLRVNKQYLADDEAALNAFLASVDVASVTSALVPASVHFWSVLVFYNTAAPESKASAAPTTSEEADRPPPPPLTASEQQRFDALRAWRTEQAQAEGVPSYVVANDQTLRLLATTPIASVDDLVSIKGLGAKRVEKYGAPILAVLEADAGETEDEP